VDDHTDENDLVDLHLKCSGDDDVPAALQQVKS